MTLCKPYSFPSMLDDIWETSTGEFGRLRNQRLNNFGSFLDEVFIRLEESSTLRDSITFKVKSFVDVINTDECNETRYSYYVPGLRRDELSVELIDRKLKLSIKHDESKPKRTTITEGTIIYELDDICDTSDEAVSTSLENGVLTVTFKHKMNKSENRKLL